MGCKGFRFGKKRGVESIVGGFFFLILLLGGFAAMLTALAVQTNLFNTQMSASNQASAKAKETFSISAGVDSNNKLFVTVNNLGGNPIQAADVWVINTASPYTTTQYAVNYADAFIPGGQSGNVLTSQTITLSLGTYNIKVVSVLGTILQTQLTVTAAGSPNPALVVKMFSVPPTISNGENVTVAMHVYNKGNSTLYNVQPNGNPIVAPSSYVNSVVLTSPSSTKLVPGADFLFTWQYKIMGGIGTQVTFSDNAQAKNSPSSQTFDMISNTDITQTRIVQGFTAQRVTPQKLFPSPAIFAAFPNPFGQANNQKGYFAVVLANPTNTTMIVNQVSLLLTSPKENDAFGSITGISPTSGWTGDQSMVYWKNTVNPVTIPKYSTAAFIVSVVTKENDISSPINILAVNAYTTFGQFGKTEYTLGISKYDTSIVNVFQSSSSAGTDQLYTISGVTANQQNTYYVTISNTGIGSGGKGNINTDTYLLINIPPGFTNISNGIYSSSLTPQPIITFDDGSQQIPVKVNTAIQPGQKATFSFVTTSPPVSSTNMYVFYLLANGTSTDKNNNVVINGPVAETIVQVCPSSGC